MIAALALLVGLSPIPCAPPLPGRRNRSPLMSASWRRPVKISPELAPQPFGARIAAFLRAAHPSKPAAHAAAATGYSTARIEKWLEGAAAPSGEAALRLLAAYGPALFTSVYPDAPAWVRVAERAHRAAQLEAEIGARQRELDDIRSAA